MINFYIFAKKFLVSFLYAFQTVTIFGLAYLVTSLFIEVVPTNQDYITLGIFFIMLMFYFYGDE